jgi:hypothetical protein
MTNVERFPKHEGEEPENDNSSNLPKEDLDDIEEDETSENLPKEDLNDI